MLSPLGVYNVLRRRAAVADKARLPHKCGEEVANLLAFIPNQATAQEVVLLKMFLVFVAGGSRKQ